MVQKIIQVGNSLAITIPKGFVKEIDIKPGQLIQVVQDSEAQTLTVSPVGKQTSREDKPSAEFLLWLKKFNTRYKEALSELAKK